MVFVGEVGEVGGMEMKFDSDYHLMFCHSLLTSVSEHS